MTWNEDFNGRWRGPAATFDCRVWGQRKLLTAQNAIDSDIVRFAGERLGFEVEEGQMPFLRSEARRGIVNCSRQWGKSTLAAIKAVHRAWTRPGSLILVSAPTGRQSGELVSRSRGFAQNLGFRLRGDGLNKMSLLFPNGSRIVWLPGKAENIRCFSKVSMLIFDESATVPDILYRTLRPMLAVGDGDLWVLGTPMGRRGFFYEEFEFGQEAWERFRIPATECPRISPAYLEGERASMGALWIRQEFMCEFVNDGGEVFDRQLVESALTDEVTALDLSRR